MSQPASQLTSHAPINRELHEAVVRAAFGQCVCTGQCGRSHRQVWGRCEIEHSPERPLHAVPRQPLASLADAIRLTADDLMAMCGACHGGMERRAARKPAPAGDLTLFGEVLLVAEGTGPLLDPACRGGDCCACPGAPCEHSCHRAGGAP
jgi:hypothetical protein